MATNSFLPYLPAELRLQIWGNAVRSDLDEPRMAVIEIEAEDEPDDEAVLFWSKYKDQADSETEDMRPSDPMHNVVRGRCSPLLDTCCESREVVERSLKRLSVSRHQHLLGPNDTLLLLPRPDPSGRLDESLRVPVAPYRLLKKLEVRSIAVLLHKEAWPAWSAPGFWVNLPECVQEVILLEAGGPVRGFTPELRELQTLTEWTSAAEARDMYFLDIMGITRPGTAHNWQIFEPMNRDEYWNARSHQDSIPLQDNYVCPKLNCGRDAGETFSWFDETLRRLRSMEQANQLEKSSSRVIRYILMPGDPFRDVKLPGRFRLG